VKQKNRTSLAGPIMVLTTGVILLLSTTDVADIEKTWPGWILAAGVGQLLRGKPADRGSQLPPPVAPPAAPGENPSSSSNEVHHG
jgi:hypothetical protein